MNSFKEFNCLTESDERRNTAQLLSTFREIEAYLSDEVKGDMVVAVRKHSLSNADPSKRQAFLKGTSKALEDLFKAVKNMKTELN